MKRWFVYGVAISIMAVTGGGAVYQWNERNAQQCNDATRQADLFTIAQMIEDYEEKAGRYPFQASDDKVTQALLASRDLIATERQSASEEPMIILDKDAFYDELERVLGAGLVVRLTDPQTTARTAPNYYQYRATNDAYYLTANLSKSVPQTLELGPDNHRFQLSSIYNAANKIYPFLQIPTDSILAADLAAAKSCS
ncbi:MAG: hypothetical protein JKY27_11460 [Magnetovibrio sp.]|nr:hypothetical protein [Magnetovibrio sp.]